MADLMIDLPNGYTLVTADLSKFPLLPDHPPTIDGHPVFTSSGEVELLELDSVTPQVVISPDPVF